MTIAQGSGLNYATFTGLYPKVSSAGEIFLMRNNGSNQIAFATDIYDTDGFSDADLYISGSKQSDGGVIAETTQSYSTSVHANTVGGTNTFTSLTDGEYEYRSLVKQDADAIEINLKKYFIVDNQRPHVWLEKLKDTDFVTATVAKGHVDTGLTANGTADDVSGVVKFYVNAFDNYLLKEIRVQCTTLSGISTWKTLATRSAAGVWTFSDYNGGTANNIDDTGYWAAFEESKSLASDADKLRLRLEINTAQVTNVARLANTLEFSAIDWAGNEVDLATYSDEQATTPVFSAASPNSGYQKSVRKMLDVVPYITEITTSLTAAFAKDFARSASGKYPVLIDTINATYEQVTVNGFNLNPVISGGASGDVRISKDIDAYNAGKVGTGLAFNTLAANKTSFKTIVQTAGSGYLSVFTNGIPSINNINAERVSNSENSSAHLTVYDDRYLSVWNINKLRQTVALANNAVYPSMKMNSNNPAFAYANNAGGWGIALYYDGTTEKKVYENWDLFTYTSIGFNSSGNHGILYDINVVNGNNGDNNSGDKGGLLTSFYYDVPGTGWNSWSYRFNDNQLWLDNLSHPTVTSVLDRYQHPDMYMNGTTDTTKVFVSFYDKLENRIIFRTFNVGTNAVIDDVTGGRINNAGTALYTNLAQYEEDGTFPEYDDTDLRFAANNNSGKTPPGQQIIESTYTGNFSAVASTTDGNTAMIVYYDASGTGGLRFKYNTTPVNSGTWVSHKNSSGTDTVLDSGYGGEFVDMAVDSQNHIHIAYYDNNNGDLRYIYMPAYDSNSSQVEKYLVDSYFDVGDKITVTVNTSDVPYIAYKGINRSGKIAWLNGSRGHGTDSSGKFTGTWECQTLPTIINDSDSNRFNIGIGTDGMPVSGYTNGGIEYIRLLPELSN
ncbi:MAG: hypothetical protein A2355_08930 [Spirochaetes bacterium RIFOXYB1_FULL_32_8]|nr:MAG: hypothetical protein A2355_08930 [Spirochaetes bacterium RIFOXYB1_FULL_32_8]